MTVATTTEVEERHSREAIEAEIGRFEERVHQLRRGEITEEQFRPFRLKHGTYGQRQPGVQMLRVKVAVGVLKPSQLRVLARIADEYSTGRGHLTTRENVQFHFVKLENVPVAMRLLADCGLTTREACGNTVRNITACPLAGICPGEAFDITPYALGVSRYLLRHPDFHDLPRKFKIAFSGCADDGGCPVIIRELLALYQQDRETGESFSSWVGRTPDKAIAERLRPLVELTNSTEDIFLDWGDTETFSLKLGRGECAA